MIQTANCGVSRIEEIVCQDRISALPEDLLVMILDLVPTKDAVATMFLSKRWLSLWTMKQRLEYKDGEDEESETDSDSDSDEDEHEHVDSSSDDEHEHEDSSSDDDEHEHEDSDDENGEKVEEGENKKSVWWFLDKSLQSQNYFYLEFSKTEIPYD